MESFNVGDKIWIINNFGISCNLLICKIVELTELELKVTILNKNNIIRKFFINQSNIICFKDKKSARLNFIAKVCKKKDLMNSFDEIYSIIKSSTGLTNPADVKKEIIESQKLFPEIWI